MWWEIASLNEHLTWKSCKFVVFFFLYFFFSFFLFFPSFVRVSCPRPKNRNEGSDMLIMFQTSRQKDSVPSLEQPLISVDPPTKSCPQKKQKGTRFLKTIKISSNCLLVAANLVNALLMINVSLTSRCVPVYMYNILVLFFVFVLIPPIIY